MKCLDWETDLYPLGMHTYADCITAVSKNGRALQDVPVSLIDASLCTLAVKDSGYALAYVPVKHIMTLEMCVIAVKNHAGSVHFVPEKFKLRCRALTKAQ